MKKRKKKTKLDSICPKCQSIIIDKDGLCWKCLIESNK